MGQGSSVLASGDWWRLTVRTTGLYRVTVADVPGLQGSDVARIGLYGAGGDMLSLKNSETSTGDLRPLAIEVHDADGDGRFGSGDWLLFFGEGTDVWRYSTADRRWEMCRHAYASENYYFLTTTAAEPRRVALAPAVEADTVTDTYTAVAMVNNDRVNLFNTGQVWLGEKFSVTTTMRSFTLSLPAVARDIKLRYALANKSAATGSFNMHTAGYDRTHYISSAGVYTTVLETVSGTAQSLTFSLTYHPGENTGEGYLDYIEMTGLVPIALGSGQTIVRNSSHLGSTAAFRYSGGGNALRLWEVTTPGASWRASMWLSAARRSCRPMPLMLWLIRTCMVLRLPSSSW